MDSQDQEQQEMFFDHLKNTLKSYWIGIIGAWIPFKNTDE
jgi:hypothetical protein